ncbi:phage virion morphogenesis protein [Tepidimonas charontis]|uniref:Uncharacterized protein n=1 Tax=Tepidimonas charontis TaxID=2267262 RepID=A0A554WZM6_9BURK|nr:hypothetical protein [Tepidimonas charontis]TSE29042.1 hypothetical protein Tchar_02627 [Tepidimonas charontis]
MIIRIDIDDREVTQALERLQRKVADLAPAMRDIAAADKIRRGIWIRMT